MADTTEDAIVDRVRDVVTALGFTEAVGFDFTRQPAGAHDKAFTVTFAGLAPIGHIGEHEEARAVVTVTVQRSIDNDYQVARRLCWQNARAILNAIVSDGSDSGIYAVDDGGQTKAVEQPVGAGYLLARLTVPVNFEAAVAV